METIFITGIGTDVGKTIAAVIVAKALQADYWKPVQAGFEGGTDSEFVRSMLPDTHHLVHPETYRLALPASPHIAARDEGKWIDLDAIMFQYSQLLNVSTRLVIEGAGGLFVPLNEKEHVIDLICRLKAKVVLVSRNYLGSINHSLLTAAVCRQRGLDVLGWIFNDEFMHYQDEVSAWSGYPIIAQVPKLAEVTSQALQQQAVSIRDKLLTMLESGLHDKKGIKENI